MGICQVTLQSMIYLEIHGTLQNPYHTFFPFPFFKYARWIIIFATTFLGNFHDKMTQRHFENGKIDKQ